ncbi:hypothetical protein E2C01_073975 [Portunus trituberculatus]|uniref:Uncharacterized protein n=1 Tax=Portunus trituberculatus TaxID=210409 RepID=A0A5B7ID37_PORTR|nr:hypothetical protein [Portunus trituberculatus]
MVRSAPPACSTSNLIYGVTRGRHRRLRGLCDVYELRKDLGRLIGAAGLFCCLACRVTISGRRRVIDAPDKPIQ